MDVIALVRRADAATGAVIERVSEDLLDERTPCDQWAVREIIDHMVTNNQDLLRKVRDESYVDSLAADFATTSRAVADAYDDPTVLDRTFDLAGFQLNGQALMVVHFADVLVHGWDIGRAVGLEVRFDDDLAAAALRVVQGFPEHLRGPGKAFAHPQPVPEDAPIQAQLLAFSGRDVNWAPAQRQAS
ncbi:TIGR03086 family metal-binding protein [Actinophytocola xanthii]|uniref:TIGR03086 family protein n=1 Tax=Actinophytocola xanthii TaxID=1912961 RepID=A0A1Q8C3N3_9PSEU|nr:TIGR03086 family metal-binding protein [Actinophytocola xanthii]OLF08968.1 TIGR03086 family protein [Actinophytocola xanthii]